MAVLLVLGLFVVIATAHNITLLKVPHYADPRTEANLDCHYVNEKEDPPLHSVKWYRDNNEIFRYTPGQEPETRTFNTTAGSITGSNCTPNHCSINLLVPKLYTSRIPFTCEVSTEGPRFAVVKQTQNITIAVTLQQDPVITGAPSTVQLGEDVTLNCSTGYAMPPAKIQWFIDGKPEVEQPWDGNTDVTVANEEGLRMTWRPLRVRVSASRGVMTIRCEAKQPMRPPYVRSTSISLAVAKSPHLSMFTASGSNTAQAAQALLMGAALRLLFKCALTEV